MRERNVLVVYTTRSRRRYVSSCTLLAERRARVDYANEVCSLYYIIQFLHAGTASLTPPRARQPKKIAVKKVSYVYVSMFGPEL